MSDKKKRVTNKEFARDNKDFIAACQSVGIPATARQASKWRNGKGSARRAT